MPQASSGPPTVVVSRDDPWNHPATLPNRYYNEHSAALRAIP